MKRLPEAEATRMTMVDDGRADDAFYTVPLKAVARFGKSGHRMNASMKKRLTEEIYQQVEHP